MRVPQILLLIVVGVSGVYSGHSYHFYQTGVSIPGHGLPEFIAVAYLDGIQSTHYSSDTRRAVPVSERTETLEPEFWERQTQINRNAEAVSNNNVRRLMSRFNHTGGFHLVQRMTGCELRGDGTSRGYDLYGYDGKDFIALDFERGVFVPLSHQAQVTAQRWNSPEEQVGERRKNYLENVCIAWLKNPQEIDKKEMEKKVRPEVKVSDQMVYGVTKLHCQVYGFYPRDVDVYWRRNGMDVPSDEAKQVLPNTDGTFQIRATVEASAEDLESYSCHVDHVSLEEVLTVKWEPRPGQSFPWITIVAVVMAIVVVAAVGFFIWRKISGRKKHYSATNTSENNGSTTSST